MVSNQNQSERIKHIIAAFQKEEPHRFEVHPEKDVFTINGKIGVRAQNQTACIHAEKTKKAYYVEGTPYQMGYLLGRMAEPDVARMCTELLERVVFEFIHLDVWPWLEAEVGKTLEVLLYLLAANIYPDVPDEYKQEMEGVLAGCRKANPCTKVNWTDLWVLNVGVDALLSYVYTGGMPIGVDRKLPRVITHKHLRIPFMCNAFSVFGPLVEDEGHFLGRDFMFPTAGVFQDTACLIIQNPVGEGKQPFVSVTAPGMIGSIAGMNARGLGVGVDMSPSGNCDPSRPGFNSLLLARHSIENGTNCEEAVDIMVEAQRGVSWNYILASYEGDDAHRACIVEAGCKVDVDDADFVLHVNEYLEKHVREHSFSQLPRQLIDHLPDRSSFDRERPPDSSFRQGLMVRWNGYEYPEEFLAFNGPLFKLFGKKYDPAAFTEKGYIDKSWKDRNCPLGYYFAPQREHDPHLVLVTNHYIIPEMRLFAMHPWTNLIASSHYDEVQWRYDELNNQLLTTLSEKKQLTLEDAKGIIDFLTPDPDTDTNPTHRKFPDYYNPPKCWCCGLFCKKPDPDAWKHLPIRGAVSLMDLKNKTIHSHYGYYGDDWVQVRLNEYLDSPSD
jgi:hypothetical protein